MSDGHVDQMRQEHGREADIHKLMDWLCRLACIELTDEEKEDFAKHIPRILEFFNKIREAPVDHLEPTFHVMEIKSVVRADNPRQPYPREDILMNTKFKKDGYFVTAKII